MKKTKDTLIKNSRYYPPTDVNPNWFDIWIEQIEDGIPAEEVLDELCRLACGVEVGASDECQRYAKHIHTHLIAAFKAGQYCSL